MDIFQGTTITKRERDASVLSGEVVMETETGSRHTGHV